MRGVFQVSPTPASSPVSRQVPTTATYPYHLLVKPNRANQPEHEPFWRFLTIRDAFSVHQQAFEESLRVQNNPPNDRERSMRIIAAHRCQLRKVFTGPELRWTIFFFSFLFFFWSFDSCQPVRHCLFKRQLMPVSFCLSCRPTRRGRTSSWPC